VDVWVGDGLGVDGGDGVGTGTGLGDEDAAGDCTCCGVGVEVAAEGRVDRGVGVEVGVGDSVGVGLDVAKGSTATIGEGDVDCTQEFGWQARDKLGATPGSAVSPTSTTLPHSTKGVRIPLAVHARRFTAAASSAAAQ
jgi:hypothetical protein